MDLEKVINDLNLLEKKYNINKDDLNSISNAIKLLDKLKKINVVVGQVADDMYADDFLLSFCKIINIVNEQ